MTTKTNDLRVLLHTDDQIWVEGDSGTLKFWILGEGLLPLHKVRMPSEESAYRRKIKKYLRGKSKID